MYPRYGALSHSRTVTWLINCQLVDALNKYICYTSDDGAYSGDDVQ